VYVKEDPADVLPEAEEEEEEEEAEEEEEEEEEAFEVDPDVELPAEITPEPVPAALSTFFPLA
jgi:hypothetical protein